MTLSTQDNEKPSQQLKTGFKRTIDWNKCKSEPTVKTSLENDAYQRSYKQYFLLTVKIKDCCSVMVYRKNFFDQPIKNDLITYENI